MRVTNRSIFDGHDSGGGSNLKLGNANTPHLEHAYQIEVCLYSYTTLASPHSTAIARELPLKTTPAPRATD